MTATIADVVRIVVQPRRAPDVARDALGHYILHAAVKAQLMARREI